MRETRIPIQSLTVIATVAIEANRFVTSAGAYAAAVNGEFLGVTRESAAIGEAVTVMTDGVATVTASAAITAGSKIAVTGVEGKIVGVADTAAGAGTSLELATGLDDTISVKIKQTASTI